MPETTAAPMQLYARKAQLTLSGSRELLSAGMTGVVQVAFSFSADWDGLHKIAVFSNGTQSVDVPQEDWHLGVCTVPAEVLTLPGKTLMVGVYGTNGSNLVLPTVWCVLGRVEPGVAPAFYAAAPPQSPFWTQMQARLAAVEAAGTLLLHVTQTSPLTLDATCAEITAAAQAGRLVMLEASGGVCPLTGFSPGVSAEFTGAVYQSAGAACYRLYTVTPSGAEVEIIPIAAAVEEEDDTFTVTISRDSGYLLQANATCAELFAAHTAGKKLLLVDVLGRLLRPERVEQDNVIFSGVSWFAPDEFFCLISYIFDEDGMTQQVVNLDHDFYTKNQINAALGTYITDVARLVGGDA